MVIKSNQTHFSWKPYSVELKYVRLLRYNFVEGQVLEILIYYRTNENAYILEYFNQLIFI